MEFEEVEEHSFTKNIFFYKDKMPYLCTVNSSDYKFI